jgi:hypothetical protein
MAAWEELNMPDQLPLVFELTLRDGSLSPKHEAGDYIKLRRDLVPESRDWVLVRTAGGDHLLREFIDLGPDGWAAAPVNQAGGDAITSRSGATVVAVYIGGGVSGRMSAR